MFTRLKKPLQSSSRKTLPAHGANQIAGFGEFRPLTNLEKKKISCDIFE